MGSIGIAAWIAKIVFPVLLVWGWTSGEFGPRTVALLVLVGGVVLFGLPLLSNGGNFVTSVLALAEIGLVLVIAKGDVRLW